MLKNQFKIPRVLITVAASVVAMVATMTSCTPDDMCEYPKYELPPQYGPPRRPIIHDKIDTRPRNFIPGRDTILYYDAKIDRSFDADSVLTANYTQFSLANTVIGKNCPEFEKIYGVFNFHIDKANGVLDNYTINGTSALDYFIKNAAAHSLSDEFIPTGAFRLAGMPNVVEVNAATTFSTGIKQINSYLKNMMQEYTEIMDDDMYFEYNYFVNEIILNWFNTYRINVNLIEDKLLERPGM